MKRKLLPANTVKIYARLVLVVVITIVSALSEVDRAHSASSDQPPQPTAGQAPTNPPAMTIILVRHAEKKVVPPENKDPDISVAGQARAQELARMFGGSSIAAIYATQFKRTQQTVKPLSDKTGIPVTKIDANKTPELVAKIRSQNAGQVVFIAGHNNTVPEIIAAMGGPQLPIIPEQEFDNLFILSIDASGTAKLLKMKYSAPAQ